LGQPSDHRRLELQSIPPLMDRALDHGEGAGLRADFVPTADDNELFSYFMKHRFNFLASSE
jgi:hypothetical protein